MIFAYGHCFNFFFAFFQIHIDSTSWTRRILNRLPQLFVIHFGSNASNYKIDPIFTIVVYFGLLRWQFFRALNFRAKRLAAALSKLETIVQEQTNTHQYKKKVNTKANKLWGMAVDDKKKKSTGSPKSKIKNLSLPVLHESDVSIIRNTWFY